MNDPNIKRRPLLAECDPYLAALRTAGRAVETTDPNLGRDYDSARYHVFQAISRGNPTGALVWMQTMDAAFKAAKVEGEMGAVYARSFRLLSALLGSV